MSRKTIRDHDFSVGDEITIYSGGGALVTRYPGIVERVTAKQVHVVYDASRTKGRREIRRSFWGATGFEIGGFPGGPRLSKREPGETFA